MLLGVSPLLRGVLALVVLPVVVHADRAPPYQEPQRPMRDSFAFLGWSEDGKRFAYETRSFGGGEPTDCSDMAALVVYDASRDQATPGATLRVASGPGDDHGHCRTPDVQAALANQRIEHLRRHEIGDQFTGPSRFERDQANDWTVALGSGRTASVKLVARDLDRPDVSSNPGRPGASYRLVVTLEGGRPLEITAARRTGVLRPDLDEALVFTDAKQRFAALCVPVVFAVTHGVWSHWDCRGLPLGRWSETRRSAAPGRE